ncbi:MAG: hypothetical protein FH749_09650 [Firmicutes bacterium]|nr:hypothetical protein [Bacillota bacterium]
MTYKFATCRSNYQDLSSGRVLYNQRGTTAFPVRLASELFQRCAALLPKSGPYTVYDPCCGGAYLLTALGFLHRQDIAAIYGSDIDSEVVQLAGKNLALLNHAGMERRTDELQALLEQYKKESHREAVISAQRLRQMIKEPLASKTFIADITNSGLGLKDIDMVITDLPYGELVQWSGADEEEAIRAMFTNLQPTLAPQGVVAVVIRKKIVINPMGYKRLARFKVGRRQAFIFTRVR